MRQNKCLKLCRPGGIGILFIVCVLLIGSCRLEKTDQSEQLSQVESTPLATIDLGDNAYIEFEELATGEILVGGMFSSMDADMTGLGKPVLEAYEYYAGEKAPPVLVDAYSRSLEIIENEAGSINKGLVDVNESVTDAPDGNSQTRMNGTLFKQIHYDGNPGIEWMTYKDCRTYRTGSAAINRYCFTQGMTVHPYRGNITFRSRTLYGSTWVTNRIKTVSQGSVYAYYIGGSWRKRKSEIFNATGDGYHYLFYGDPVLCRSKWGQGGPYNSKVKVPNNQRLGCWSVAYAQILKTLRRPPSGKVTYTTSHGWHFNNVNIGGRFSWDLISGDLNSPGTTEAEKNATARFCFNTALVCQANFPDGYQLNTGEAAEEIADHFNCITARYSTAKKTMNQLEQIIKNEINARRPVWMYLTSDTTANLGHAVVIDEYRGSGFGFEVHLNMGWNGSDNDFYNFYGTIGDFDINVPDLDDNDFRYIVTVRPKT